MYNVTALFHELAARARYTPPPPTSEAVSGAAPAQENPAPNPDPDFQDHSESLCRGGGRVGGDSTPGSICLCYSPWVHHIDTVAASSLSKGALALPLWGGDPQSHRTPQYWGSCPFPHGEETPSLTASHQRRDSWPFPRRERTPSLTAPPP